LPSYAPPVHIAIDDLQGAEIIAFLEAHVAQMRSLSPPESTHALDLAGLRAPGVWFWTATDDGEIIGCAALKRLDDDHAELKSMRTATHRTRQGIASRLVAHVLDEARGLGFTRMSLETGAEEFFAAARALYARHGFDYCEPFADYRPDPLSVFMTREL
jgi:putative acetyltransferase